MTSFLSDFPDTVVTFLNNNGERALQEFYDNVASEPDEVYIGTDGKVIANPGAYQPAAITVQLVFYSGSGSLKTYTSFDTVTGAQITLTYADTTSGGATIVFGPGGGYTRGTLISSEVTAPDGSVTKETFDGSHLTSYQLDHNDLHILGSYDAANNTSSISLTNTDHGGLSGGAIIAAGGGNIDALVQQNHAGIISSDGASLIGSDSASLIGSDSASLIGSDSASLDLGNTASLIGSDSASLIGSDSASLLSEGGAGILSSGFNLDNQGLVHGNGADLIGTDSASFAASFMANASLNARFYSQASAAPTDDFTADTTTSGTLSVGGSATGALESLGDRDWFAVDIATAGKYIFEVKGDSSGSGSLTDPWLRIFDGSGNQIGQIDDGGTGLDARDYFTITTPGTYYLEASSRGDQAGGSYTVAVNAVPTVAIDAVNDDDRIDTLTASSNLDLPITRRPPESRTARPSM